MREVKLFLFCKWDSSWVWGVRWLTQDTAVTQLRATEWLALLLLSECYPASLECPLPPVFIFSLPSSPYFQCFLFWGFFFFFFLLCFLPCLLLFIGVHHQRQEKSFHLSQRGWAELLPGWREVVGQGWGGGFGILKRTGNPSAWPQLIPLEFKMNYIISKFWLRKERGTFHLYHRLFPLAWWKGILRNNHVRTQGSLLTLLSIILTALWSRLNNSLFVSIEMEVQTV